MTQKSLLALARLRGLFAALQRQHGDSVALELILQAVAEQFPETPPGSS